MEPDDNVTIVYPQNVIVARATGTYGVRMGVECAVHSHDGWVPLVWHHIHPLGDGGPDSKENQVRVCANGHYSIHALLDALKAKDGSPSWEFERHFSPAVRALAYRGWNEITK